MAELFLYLPKITCFFEQVYSHCMAGGMYGQFFWQPCSMYATFPYLLQTVSGQTSSFANKQRPFCSVLDVFFQMLNNIRANCQSINETLSIKTARITNDFLERMAHLPG